VAEDGQHRRTALECGSILLGNDLAPEWDFTRFLGLLFLHCFGHGLESIFGHHNRGSVEIDSLIDSCHDAVRHQFFDDLDGAFFDHYSKVTDDNAGREFDLASVFIHGPPPSKISDTNGGWRPVRSLAGTRERGANRSHAESRRAPHFAGAN
jgi:hypothetical protein